MLKQWHVEVSHIPNASCRFGFIQIEEIVNALWMSMCKAISKNPSTWLWDNTIMINMKTATVHIMKIQFRIFKFVLVEKLTDTP